MPTLSQLIWGVILLCVRHAQCQNEFIEPPPFTETEIFTDNPIYELGDELTIEWNMDLTNIRLIMWQTILNEVDVSRVLLSGTNDTSYDWTVSYELMDERLSKIFYFEVKAADNTNFYSHYFNISDSSASPSSTSSSSSTTLTSTSTSTSTISTKTNPPGSQTSSSAASPTAPDENKESSTSGGGGSSGISAGTGAGIAVGAVAGIAIILGLIWFFMKKKGVSVSIGRNGQQPQPGVGFPPPGSAPMTPMAGAGGITPMHSPPPPEMSQGYNMPPGQNLQQQPSMYSMTPSSGYTMPVDPATAYNMQQQQQQQQQGGYTMPQQPGTPGYIASAVGVPVGSTAPNAHNSYYEPLKPLPGMPGSGVYEAPGAESRPSQHELQG